MLDTLAAIILCAAHDHNPWVNGFGTSVPNGIPLRNLIENNDSIPSICVFRQHTHLTFEAREFNTVDEVVKHATTIRKVRYYFSRAFEVCSHYFEICAYYVLWIANAIRKSVESGFHSSWNWGAPLGMVKTEFIHRITPTFNYGGYSDLAIHMHNRAEESTMDFGMLRFIYIARYLLVHLACAALVDSKASRLIYTTRETDPMDGEICYVSAWPWHEDEIPSDASSAPAVEVVKALIDDSGVEDINQHLRQLELDCGEESMEVEPYVL